MSILSRPLRFQLWVAFSLMSVLPILVLVNLLVPGFSIHPPFVLVVFFVVVFALMGLYLAKRIIDEITQLRRQAEAVAGGEVSLQFRIRGDDEIADLSRALNVMTRRIKDGMEELKIYGERTKGINVQIQKQMVALDGLLEVGRLMTKGGESAEVFRVMMARLAQSMDAALAFVVAKKEEGFDLAAQHGCGPQVPAWIAKTEHKSLWEELLLKTDCFEVREGAPGVYADLLNTFGAKSVLFCPIALRNRSLGVLGIGHQAAAAGYQQEDKDVMSIYAKQLAVSFDNMTLLRRLKDLEVVDEATGLYNRRYMVERLQEEILRAISLQQPCAFIVFAFKSLGELAGQESQPMPNMALCQVARALERDLGELDRVGRIDTHEFAVVLPGRNKKDAKEAAQLMKEKIADVLALQEQPQSWIVSAAVVENPVDGSDAAALFEKATTLLKEQAITIK